MRNQIKIGDNIKTNLDYKKSMYEPLYFEEILDGKVLDIDKNSVVTYELIKSSCNLNGKFNNHMNSWREGSIKMIGLGWLELKEDDN